ncbi:MAG: dockerin type I repeat-containing protein [Alistipes senegalensis]|nr:dockerin type I repeat-containing protein [Alistipes senegalensis]
MKKILSALMSMTVALSAMPVISNAETENPDIKEPFLSEALPCYVDGKTAVFEGDKSYDFVTVVAPDSKFTTERTDNTMEFTPEQDGKFIVSKVWLEEQIIDYPIRVWYDLMPDIKADAGYIDGHCHYFYPHIQNYEITYNSETGTKIEFLGERYYINTQTVSDIASGNNGICQDFIEMETDDIFNDGSYYALATRVSPAPFIYFDYGYESETKKDKSVFCIESGYYEDFYESGDYKAISVSGNAEKTDTFYGGSYIDGNLMEGTCDIVAYTLIEPTGDGLAEVYYDPNYNSPLDVLLPPVIMMLTVKDGKFIPDITTIGDDLMSGDMNFDYKVNIADAVLLQKYIFGKTNFTATQYACADMNFDGIVDIFDMVLFRQEMAGSEPVIYEPIDTIK